MDIFKENLSSRTLLHNYSVGTACSKLKPEPLSNLCDNSTGNRNLASQ